MTADEYGKKWISPTRTRKARSSSFFFFYKPHPEDPALMYPSCHRARGSYSCYPFFLARTRLSIFVPSFRYWRGDSSKRIERDV